MSSFPQFFFLFFFSFFSFLFAGELKEAYHFFKEKKYDQAQELYQNFLRENPQNEAALYYLGRIFLQKGEYKSAEEFLRDCLEQNPKNVDAKFFLAYALYHQQKYEEAKKLWEEVLETSPNYVDAYIALSRLYSALDEPQKAKKMLQRAEAISPDNSQLLILSAHNLQTGQNFKGALVQYEKAAQKGAFSTVLANLTALRPYVYPSLKAEGFYDREVEQDLILKIDTTKIKTHGTLFRLHVPLANYFSLYGIYQYFPYTQINLLRKINNYKVINQKMGGGIHLYFRDTYDIVLEALYVKGKGTTKNIFPFRNVGIWEPKFSVSVYPDPHLLRFSAYKAELIARTNTDIFSYYVKQKVLSLAYEYRFLPKFYGIGVETSYSWYKALQTNKKKEASFWLRFPVPHLLKELIHLRYDAKIGSFSFVDDDYFSYRRRLEQRATFILLREWGDRGSLKASYEYSWQRVRGFNNINEAILLNPSSSEIINLNFIRGDTFQIVGKKAIGSHFHLEGKAKAYFDDDQYRAYFLQASIKGVF